MDLEKNYHSYNGTKLEYCATQSGSYTRIYGLKTIPDIGGEPNKIDTTDLDNTEYETNMYGLKPAQAYTFDFNMQDPSAEANIKLVSDMEDAGSSYYWKLTYSNGLVLSFQSKVKTTILGGQSNDLIGFQLHLAPKNEPTKTIPTSASL